MALPDIFNNDVTDRLIQRINNLTAQSKPQWGKMSVAQMLAHCCVTYRYVYEPEQFKKPNFLISWILKTFVKKAVVNEVGYKHNTRTGPDFIINDEKDFEQEKSRLIDYLVRVQKDGKQHFDGKASFSFGKLSVVEWNNMFYKHLNHHLTQFGV